MAQHQGSLRDQLQELYNLANKNGLYDAADFLRDKINVLTDKQVESQLRATTLLSRKTIR